MSNRQRGFALLVVLWTVGFLALLGTQIVAAGRSDTQLADNLKQQARLEAAANGVIAQVMFLMLAAHDPRFRADGVVREARVGVTPVLVRIENEADRVNLNTASGILLQNLMIELGTAPAIAQQIAAAILDWRTSSATARPNGAKAPAYRAAGRSYGPPNSTFQSVDELADVLGMSPALYARMAPHLTVLSDGDPDLSTRDPIVAQALVDAAAVADESGLGGQTADPLLRIEITALGTGQARYSLQVVASADFQAVPPHINILLRDRDGAIAGAAVAASQAASRSTLR